MANTWIPPEQYIAKLPRITAYGCLFFTDTDGRVPQLRSSVQQHPGIWQWPGGNTDQDESPFDTAVRECREETGIQFGGAPKLLAVHWMSPSDAWPALKTGFVFDGGELTQEEIFRIRLDPGEHDLYSVRSLERWAEVMETQGWQRLAAVHDARRTGTVAYIEMRPDAIGYPDPYRKRRRHPARGRSWPARPPRQDRALGDTRRS
ncbi:NUDIX hydrolase [Streptomyces netropsis]|uniref:NUDIX hydrolase n=1 Tax=Streptomyces netropsis TaxID=55404 RepID=UPI0030D12BC0